MAELRGMLAALRPDERAGLPRIEQLLAGVRATGVDVTLCSQGTPWQPAPASNAPAAQAAADKK